MATTSENYSGSHRKWFVLGGWFTLAYLACLIAIATFSKTPIWQLDLNEIGDFCAGAFAPLAFFWFVLAFIQQGIELRQSVNETRALVKETGEQVELMRGNAKLELEKINLEKTKLARSIAESTRDEICSILAKYIYIYEQKSYLDSDSRIETMGMSSGEKVKIREQKKKQYARDYINSSWERYQRGDKNTFFRTFSSYVKYYDSSKNNQIDLVKFIYANRSDYERFSELQSKLGDFTGSDLDGVLIDSTEAIATIEFIDEQLNK